MSSLSDLTYLSPIISLTRRRIAARFRGSLLGAAWIILLPLLMVALFTIVFTHFLPVRWPSLQNTDQISPLHTALNIYLGLIVFNFVAENLASAPSLVLENPNYVKKIPFPLTILAYINTAASVVPLLAGLIAAITLAFFDPLARPVNLLLAPLYWLPLLVWAVAIHWLFGAISVYVRDILHLIPPLTTALMFLSPIFYSAETLPAPWNTLLTFNPLTPAIEAARVLLYPPEPSVLLFPDPFPSLLSAGGALITAVLARRFFHYLKPGFADVL